MMFMCQNRLEAGVLTSGQLVTWIKGVFTEAVRIAKFWAQNESNIFQIMFEYDFNNTMLNYRDMYWQKTFLVYRA